MYRILYIESGDYLYSCGDYLYSCGVDTPYSCYEISSRTIKALIALKVAPIQAETLAGIQGYLISGHIMNSNKELVSVPDNLNLFEIVEV